MLVKSQVKYIQSLGHKKFREAEGAFIAEGPKIVQELLQCMPASLIKLYATREWLLENETELPTNGDVIEIDAGELERISFLSAPNQVLTIFRKPVFPVPEDPEGIILLLDNIQDPGNLGTIVRTADWFGVRRIICSMDTADAYNPKVVQATMGSIGRVEVLYTDLKEYIREHPRVPSFAAVLDGKDLDQIQWIREGLIILGNESRGIDKELAALAQYRIRITPKGAADSLNVAVATGIILSLIQKG